MYSGSGDKSVRLWDVKVIIPLIISLTLIHTHSSITAFVGHCETEKQAMVEDIFMLWVEIPRPNHCIPSQLINILFAYDIN